LVNSKECKLLAC